MIRKAKISDVKQIHKLINFYADKDYMLPRSLNELYEHIRDFFVKVERGKVIGCCALHISWEDLAEIKSLAVEQKFKGKGIGALLVRKCLDGCKEMGVQKVFVLTYIPEFFEKFDFKAIDKEKLPHKIWSECINCPHFPDCNEVALIKKVASSPSIRLRTS